MSNFCRKRSPKSAGERSSKRRMTIELCVPSDDDDEVPIVETTNKAEDKRLSRMLKTKQRLAPTKLCTTTPKSEPDRVMLEEDDASTMPLTVDSDAEENCKPLAVARVQSSHESDEEEDAFCRTLDSLTNSCWKCSAKFKLAEDEFCLYAMHMHPLLKVPICSVCAEEVLAVELQSSHGDWCSGCGRHEDDVEMLLLCDDCPRAFCDTCTALAHGGGQQGQEAVNRLAESSHDSWSCPHCQPPSPLETLQQHTERISSQEETPQRTVEVIMMELDKVELERMECEKTTLPQVLEHQREEFGKELRKTYSSPTDLQEAVESEMQDWQEMWSRHDQRLADLAASLQDELEMHENIDLAACYRQLEGKTTVDIDEPDWKRAADAVIDRREQEEEENDEPPVAISDPSVYKRDIGDDEIEDLDTPDPEGHQKKSQWRHNREGARKEDIDEALKFEEEMLRLRRCAVTRVCNDRQDVKEIEEEEHEASARGAGGVSRIRMDVYQVVRQQAARSTDCSGARAPKMPGAAHADSGQRVVDAGCLKHDNETNLSEANSVDSVENDVTLNFGANIFSNSSLVLSSASLVGDDTVDVANARRKIQTITIAEPLAKALKSHQAEGVRFMWRNTFSDLAYTDASNDGVGNVGGCVLAHNMGLGKSLSCIALAHALLNHPSLVLHPTQHPASQLIRCVLLVVPTNVLSHWEEEFEKWTGELVPSVQLYNLGNVGKEACAHTIKIWSRRGGILLVSKGRFVSLKKSGKYNEALQDPGPDVVIVDEGHLMLTKTSNEIFKALSGIRSKRRIALTGSPIQNNLLEYFRMVNWVRPGVLGSCEKVFDKEYVGPIMMGMASDSSALAVRSSNDASRKLYRVLSPYLHRKDAKVLRKDLPPMQQCVLHIRQSKTQTRLYRAFKAFQKARSDNNFFRCYQMTRPLTNHPGTLLMSGQNNERAAISDDGAQRVVPTSAAAINKPTLENVAPEAAMPTEKSAASTDRQDVETICLLSDSEIEDFDDNLEAMETSEEPAQSVPPTAGNTKESPNYSPVRKEVVHPGVLDTSIGADPVTATGDTFPIEGKEWWRKTAERNGNVENLKDIENGYKVLLLLHILVQAQELGDKVLLFSQCLRTLDFIEEVLNLEDWGKHAPSLASSFPNAKFRAWRKNVDYLRIDGETKTTERGSLINQFNDMKSSEQERITAYDDKTKLFLLSAKAGGIGVNLIAANRVVLFDNHFNPTIMTQALYRCYRYGQSKPVFAYRFMTEGSMEEKIYSRSVNKTGVALRVIDGKSIGRHFTERELKDLQTTDTWVQCDGCEKWRMLPIDAESGELPDKWYCEMNKDDDVNNNCSASEKDSEWYGRHFSDQLEVLKDSPVKCIVLDSNESAIPQDQKALLIDRDEILKHLLKVTAVKQKKSVISKYYFHDTLLEETEDDVFEAVGQEALSEDSEKASSSTVATQLFPPAAEPKRSKETPTNNRTSTNNPTLEAVPQAASSCRATSADGSTPPTRRRYSTPLAVNPNNEKANVSPSTLKTPHTVSSTSSDQTESQLPNESKLKCPRLYFPASEPKPSEEASTKNSTLEAVAQAVSSCMATGADVSSPPTTRKRYSTPSAVNPNNEIANVSPSTLKTPHTASSTSSDQTESQLPNESKLKRPRLCVSAAEAKLSEEASMKNPTLEAVAKSSCRATGAYFSTPPTRKRYTTRLVVNPNNEKANVSRSTLKTPHLASATASDQTESQLPHESKLKRQGTPSSAKKEMKRTRMSPRGATKAKQSPGRTPIPRMAKASRKVKVKNLREESLSGQGGSPQDEPMLECHGTATSSTATRKNAHDRPSSLRLQADSTYSSRKLGETRQQQESKELEFIDLFSSSSVSTAEVIDLVDSTDLESDDAST